MGQGRERGSGAALGAGAGAQPRQEPSGDPGTAAGTAAARAPLGNFSHPLPLPITSYFPRSAEQRCRPFLCRCRRRCPRAGSALRARLRRPAPLTPAC